jgi:drug/metabolite transporter (DMT)-like permease
VTGNAKGIGGAFRGRGWALVIFTVLSWGSLVILLKLLVPKIDPFTLTWYRLTFGAILIFAFSGATGIREVTRGLNRRRVALIVIAGSGLAANYILFLSGLFYLTPGVALIVMQVAPYMMLAGGVLIFGEVFARRQLYGGLFLLVGSLFFFNQRYEELQSLSSGYAKGVVLALMSAVGWAAYLLIQRRLIRDLDARTIVTGCYIVGSLELLPFTSPGQVQALEGGMILLLPAVILLTAVSHVAFSAALRYVDASKAGLALGNVPIVALIGTAFLSPWVDGLEADDLNIAAILGALMIVGGTAFAAYQAPLTPAQKRA